MLPSITATTLVFLGTKAIPEAAKAARDAYAANPGAAGKILQLLNQENIQDAAKAMQELAPKCAPGVSKALIEAAKHLRS